VDGFSRYEVRLALRNREMPLEALALDITPPGLHYVLAHHDIPLLDVEAWRLEVGGLVREPLRLSLEDLGRYAHASETVTLECAGNGRAVMEPRHHGQPWHHGGVSTAMWSGVRLIDVLAEARLDDRVTHLAFHAADEGIEDGVRDRYAWGLPVDDASRSEVLLASEMAGRPLEPQHGAPVRLVVPGWYGMASVKWLVKIEALDAPFAGSQLEGYRLVMDEDDPGRPISRIGPRALMVPPGIPIDDPAVRLVDDRVVELTGRAWSGLGSIDRVEIILDGSTWKAATVVPSTDRFGWVRWEARIDLRTRGDHELGVRATDRSGTTQPDQPPWNLWGYANNAIQRVRIRWL
jgi:sulfane dehydrogenase subunit SoxC